MKNKGIKLNLLINFFVAAIIAMITTLIGIFAVILFLHLWTPRGYMRFINAYNTNNKVMIGFLIGSFAIFILLMCLVFIKRMNKITNYLEEISENLNRVSEGDMAINIPIRRKDELGTLALNVNQMAYSIKELMRKERQWEKQKNHLITNLSHDLRTPLTSVIGFLELIEKGNYKSEAELMHYCQVSLSKAKQLKSSVDQLFEFTKINNQDVKLNKSNIELCQLIEQVTMGFIPSFEDHHMTYSFFLKDKNLVIQADPILLVRAFENIISNAIKYASKGKYLEIHIEKENNMATVSFINYGDKIEEEDLNNLFERLYRAEKTCDKKEGTGLGLAIVKTIVELHKGKIEVVSTEKRTAFKIKLPLED